MRSPCEYRCLCWQTQVLWDSSTIMTKPPCSMHVSTRYPLRSSCSRCPVALAQRQPLGTTWPQRDRAGLLGGIQRAQSGIAAAGRRRTDTWGGGCAPCCGALPCQPHGMVTNPSGQTTFLCSYCQMRTFSLHANRSGRGLGNKWVCSTDHFYCNLPTICGVFLHLRFHIHFFLEMLTNNSGHSFRTGHLQHTGCLVTMLLGTGTQLDSWRQQEDSFGADPQRTIH